MEYFRTRCDAETASKHLKKKAPKKSLFSRLLSSHSPGSAPNLLPKPKIPIPILKRGSV